MQTTRFKKDLAYGQDAETEFHKLYPTLERLDGRRADFRTTEGFLVEVKSDRYDPSKTQNYFMERYSFRDVDGGVFQSLKNGVDIYVYWFPLTGLVKVFSTKDLAAYLLENYNDSQLIEIVNESHITRGWKVPRSELLNLELSPEVLK